ncbi:hypothetical protein H257_12140 [Aphanomyces astaci]|uniref:Uncharacterized protein n=1 Tax=Aphanomyces astaci TaxID=112090 RepID=W4FZ72_APHAT|nr:hypothetical protein H257_12140 [Aphanomyces astaci]ETV72772.1 hypothetical protein H257_12140 [Aphanomyces astaci]|eukprot:XP_009837558.1 hypothetical protein H257_12140 [Aphanomyces astaci]
MAAGTLKCEFRSTLEKHFSPRDIFVESLLRSPPPPPLPDLPQHRRHGRRHLHH